ncbi:hypothetical protein [Oceanobacillus bengalensis]|uniref:Uncharacterized protein n=1 Tax=Oceanobacillus bengalensis TaxID=1435466 RepID=A0A494YVY4_9BACI|nr:hypothetical protein [Oceanobacillus bengalensis]RKQ14370.1 hypothetical protein D8M05_13150 [Oceanobacillus bengalensis]
MGRQIKGLLYFFATDIRHSLMIFWTILLSILVVSLSISYFLLSVEGAEYYLSLSVPIYIYCSILGFITVKESIPFSLKMGATRKNLFISLGIFFLVLAVAKSIFANIIHALTLLFTDATNIHIFRFIHPAAMLEDTWANRVIIDIAIMFLSFSVMFLIGLLFYKYGLAGGGIVSGVVVVVLLFGIAQGWLIDFFADVFRTMDLTLFIQMIGIGMVVYLLSFIFMRRITTVKAK